MRVLSLVLFLLQLMEKKGLGGVAVADMINVCDYEDRLKAALCTEQFEGRASRQTAVFRADRTEARSLVD